MSNAVANLSVKGGTSRSELGGVSGHGQGNAHSTAIHRKNTERELCVRVTLVNHELCA